MVSVASLWMSIVLSAVLVFVLSSLIHMVFKWHNKDHKSLPQEDNVLQSMRDAGVSPGSYYFPSMEGLSWSSPELKEKYTRGPSGFLTVFAPGPPNMGKSLLMWFVYLLILGVGVAWILAHSFTAGAAYKSVFLSAAVAAALPHVASHLVHAAWKGQGPRETTMHMIDGVLYALLTAGAFAGLWPG